MDPSALAAPKSPEQLQAEFLVRIEGEITRLTGLESEVLAWPPSVVRDEHLLAICAVRQGLQWVAQPERIVTPTEFCRPWPTPFADLTQEQQDGLACALCGTAAKDGPVMIPVAQDGDRTLFACEGGCPGDPEIEGVAC